MVDWRVILGIRKIEGQYETALSELTLLAEETFEAHERIEILLAMADLAEEQLLDLDTGREALKMILDIDPANQQALQRLEPIYMQTENWTELLDLLVARADQSQDQEERASCLAKAALLSEEMLSDYEAAKRLAKMVLAVDPENQTALEIIERMLME